MSWKRGPDERTAAIAEMTEVAAGRVDLLARCAASALSMPDDPMTWRDREVAELCVAAGADPEEIERLVDAAWRRSADLAPPGRE